MIGKPLLKMINCVKILHSWNIGLYLCIIFSRIIKSPVMLRVHIKRFHDKEKGT